MMTMLEKAAKAIHALDAKTATERVASSMWTNGRPMYEGLARAALMAIREPDREQSLAMQKALLENWPKLIGEDVCVNGRLSEAAYQAAIDAILEGKA